MWLDEKVDLVEGYLDKIRSATLEIVKPAVVRLKKYVHLTGRVRFRRSNVLARDNFECQYCSVRPVTKQGLPDFEQLTIDHVVPRSHARNCKVVLPWNKKVVHVTTWENVVACCAECNHSKAARTPEQAGMKLRKKPRKPNAQDVLRMTMSRTNVPPEWDDYLIL